MRLPKSSSICSPTPSRRPKRVSASSRSAGAPPTTAPRRAASSMRAPVFNIVPVATRRLTSARASRQTAQREIERLTEVAARHRIDQHAIEAITYERRVRLEPFDHLKRPEVHPVRSVQRPPEPVGQVHARGAAPLGRAVLDVVDDQAPGVNHLDDAGQPGGRLPDSAGQPEAQLGEPGAKLPARPRQNVARDVSQRLIPDLGRQPGGRRPRWQWPVVEVRVLLQL